MEKNVTVVPHALDQSQRKAHYGHAGAVIWMTGLPASGKSSLAMALEEALSRLGYSCYVLDGDNIRTGLNANLGFSPEDRTENIRRVGEVAALFANAGLICITAFISPYRADRARARQCCGDAFHEIYLSADLATCVARDPKGLYKRARSGDLPAFTGIGAPYEAPHHAQLTVDNTHETLTTSVATLVAYILRTVPLARAAAKEHP